MKTIQHTFFLFLLFLSIISCSSNGDDAIQAEQILDLVNQETPGEAPIVTPEEPIEEEPEEEVQEFFLNKESAPSENFDLSKWNLGVPIAESDGTSSDISTTELIEGYQNVTYFYTSPIDGAMVFKNFISGPKTSSGTSYTRSELREMIYGTTYDTQNGLSTKDIENNWNFSFFDANLLENAGGIDGELTATVAVNHVTTTTGTGDNEKESQIGRVIIGQIHAKDDEPCRLYYRKLPNNTKGSIYFAHEPTDASGNDEEWYDLIGSRSTSASDPEDGIALDEKFSYSIKVSGVNLTVTISRFEKDDVSKTIDMSNSGFGDVDNQYMYFKAGAYTQNNTGDADDYDEVSFYELNVTH